MNDQPPPGETYGPKWYQKRAFQSLAQIDEGVWDYSDSLLLYVADAQDQYETIQKTDNPYSSIVTKPERDFLESVATAVADRLPNEFAYIDLGPGTEHKESFIFEALKKQNKHFTYAPVDINKDFLESAASYALGQGIQVHPLLLPFEELPEKLHDWQGPRFVSLGLTYSNYDPNSILTLLKVISGDKGQVFVDTQIRDRVDMKEVAAIYSRDVYAIAEPKLKLLGLNPQTDIADHICDDGVRVWSILRNSTPELEQRGIFKGAKLLVFQSLRPTLESFQRDIASVFPSFSLLDTGGPFVGAILESS